MRFSSLLFILLFSQTILAQIAVDSSFRISSGKSTVEQSSPNGASLTGTIKVSRKGQAYNKVETTESIPFESVHRNAAKGTGITLAGYSEMAGEFDKRYATATEFQVDIFSGNTQQSYSSTSKYPTSEMEAALEQMQKTGGSASFKFIKTQRKDGQVSLPSFTYTVN